MRNLSVIKGMYQGNGVTRRFAIPFEYNDTAQIFVTVTTYDDGDYTYRVLDRTEFTIDEDSVEIVYPKSADDTPISNSQYLTVWRDTDLLQLIDLTNQGAAWPDSIEGSFDKLHQIVQELAEGLSRALKVDIGDPQTPDQKLIAIQDYVLAAAESSRSASASEASAQRSAESAATSAANAAESERLAGGYADTATAAASRAEDSAISARAYNAPDYDNSKTYQAGEVVTYTDGNSYRALQETTGHEPPNIIYWQKVTDYVGDDFFEVDEYGYIVPMDSPSHSRYWRVDQNGYIVPIEGGDGGYRPDTRQLSAEYLNVTNEGYIKHLRADDINAQEVDADEVTADVAAFNTLTANAVNAGTLTANSASVAEISAGTLTADDVIAKGPIVDVRAFGAKGDGVADDTAAIQAAINAGGYILFDRDKTYFVTAELHPKSNSIVNFNGATLIYTPANLIDNCIKLVGENIYLLNGSIIPKNVSFDSTLGDGGNFMPINIGAYGGTEASSDGRQWDDEAKNIVIENMTIYGRFNVETGINIVGDSHDICIRNCGFIAGQTSDEQMSCGIMIHWGGDHVSQRDGTQGTPPTITLHPHNIEISNCRFENVGYLQTVSSNGHCIYLSAAYNISIRNCEFDNIMTGIVVTPGDDGYQFGANNESANGINITACSGRGIKGHGIRIQGKPTFYDYYEPMGVNVTNCKFVGTGTSQLSTGNDFGVVIGQLPAYSGKNSIPVLTSVSVENFYSGIRVDNASAIINDSTIYNSRSHGIIFESVTGALLHGCAVAKSKTDTTTDVQEEIKISNSEKIKVNECFIGDTTQDNCAFGIYLFKSIKCTITNNTFGNFDELNGSAIYVNKSTYADYETYNIVENNTFISPNSIHKIGGDKTFTTDIQNVSYGSAAPTTGNWRAGDRVYALGPGNAGVGCIGWVCITSGTPGTWKKFGLLES